MKISLFNDNDRNVDLGNTQIIMAIMNVCAYVMHTQTKQMLNDNVRKVIKCRFVDVDKNIDYCVENNILQTFQKRIHNGTIATFYMLEPHRIIDVLYNILNDKILYATLKGKYFKNPFGNDYYVDCLRESLFRYFSQNSNSYLYTYTVTPVEKIFSAMFDDERYHGYLIDYAKYRNSDLNDVFKNKYLSDLNARDLAVFRKIFIDNTLISKEDKERYRSEIKIYENILPLEFDGKSFDVSNTTKYELCCQALYYQYNGNYDAAVKLYEKANKSFCFDALSALFSMTHAISLIQLGTDTALKKLQRLKKSIEKIFPCSLAACIVADFGIEKSVKKHFKSYEGYLPKLDDNRFAQLLAIIVLKKLGDNVEKIIPENLIDSIANEPKYKLLKFEMSSCFDKLIPEKETIQKEVGFEPLMMSLKPEEEWKLLIDKLNNVLNPNGEGAKALEKRLIYVIDDKFNIYRYSQKLLKSGKYGKPNLVDYWKEDDMNEYMTEFDKKISSYKNSDHYYRRNRYYNLKVFNEFVGSELVFRIDGSDMIPLKIEKSEPSIFVNKTKSGIKIKTDFKISDIEDGMILKYDETKTVIKVISLYDNQEKIIELFKENVTFPEKSEKILADIVQKINKNYNISIQSDLIQTDENTKKVESDSLITGVLRPVGDGLNLKFFVKPLVTTPPYCEPGKGTATVLGMIDGEQVQAVRNLDIEKKNFDCIKGLLQQNLYPDYTNSIETTGIVESLTLLDFLQKNQDVVRTEWPEGCNFKLAGSADFKNLIISVKSDNQWLDVEGELKVGEDVILKMSELLEKVRDTKERFIRLDDKTFLMLSEQLKKQLDLIASMANIDRKKVKLSVFEAFAMEGFEENGTNMQADKFYKDIVRKIKDSETLTFEIPKGLKAELRDYQEDGYRWMMRLNSWGAGACLADDMGLGKTLQAITVMLKKADEGPSLVVCPASVLLNWRNEIEKFAPSLTPILIHNADKQRADKISNATDHDIVLITYGILITEVEKIAEKQWNTIVLDEAHTIKNKETKMSKAAMNLKGDFKIILTGTPLQNHLGEIWNLFQFVNPGLLGTFGHFTDNYIMPIVKNEDKLRQKQLKNRLLPFMLRRTKNDVLDELPEKTEIVLGVEMSETETAFYENLRRIAIEKVSESDNAGIQTLAEITRLRQAACNAKLVDEKLNITSSKSEVFMELVGELCGNNHRALVFSQFTSHLALIIKKLEEANIKFLYLDGSTPVKEREKLVKTFQKSDDIPLFLISMKAGGLGLNLTAADYIIHLDPWWNPAVEDQASDRAYRIGQTRPVTVYRLISKNTIEEKIIKLHQTKKSLADALLDGSDMSHKLTKEEMLELLGVKVK